MQEYFNVIVAISSSNPQFEYTVHLDTLHIQTTSQHEIKEQMLIQELHYLYCTVSCPLKYICMVYNGDGSTPKFRIQYYINCATVDICYFRVNNVHGLYEGQQ